MDGKFLARIGAIVFVAVAITATAIEMTRKQDAPTAWGATRPQAVIADPLRDELFRCQALGEGGPRDPSCLRAWAENRQRFLAPGARPTERLPEAASRVAPPSNPTSAATPSDGSR
jgi:conjugative transfer region protein TrbK